MGDNPLAKAPGLSPHTSGKPCHNYYLYTYMYVLIHVMEIFYVCVHTGYEDFVCMNMFI